jgi:hypothetical protein
MYGKCEHGAAPHGVVCLHALQDAAMPSSQISMTTNWMVSPEYITEIWQTGRRKPLFGASVSAEQYQLTRNGLTLGSVQKEDLTFKAMKSCTDADGQQQFTAAFHTQNEFGEITSYAGVYTKRPEEVVPVLQELQKRYKPGQNAANGCVACSVLCSSMSYGL